MDYKKIVEEMGRYFKIQVEGDLKRAETYRKKGMDFSFAEGILLGTETSSQFLEELRRIYA